MRLAPTGRAAALAFVLGLPLALGLSFARADAPAGVADSLDRYLSARTELGRFSGAVLVARGDRAPLPQGLRLRGRRRAHALHARDPPRRRLHHEDVHVDGRAQAARRGKAEARRLRLRAPSGVSRRLEARHRPAAHAAHVRHPRLRGPARARVREVPRRHDAGGGEPPPRGRGEDEAARLSARHEVLDTATRATSSSQQVVENGLRAARSTTSSRRPCSRPRA
jgi:hypothetical protein